MSKPRRSLPRTSTELIRELKAGKIIGKGVPMESRQDCVQRLWLEGFANAEIAELFGKNERTIRRDLAEIRKRNAIHPSQQIVAEMLGEFHLQVQTSVKRLRRVGRDSRTSPADQIAAERAIAESLNNLIKRFHSIGLTNGMGSVQDESANLAELLHAVTVIGKELGEDSEMGIQVISLLESIRGSIDKGNTA
jgi:DNA-binding CsgD family transcriptional regulator